MVPPTGSDPQAYLILGYLYDTCESLTHLSLLPLWILKIQDTGRLNPTELLTLWIHLKPRNAGARGEDARRRQAITG
jgi:hypothetical protein